MKHIKKCFNSCKRCVFSLTYESNKNHLCMLIVSRPVSSKCVNIWTFCKLADTNANMPNKSSEQINKTANVCLLHRFCKHVTFSTTRFQLVNVVSSEWNLQMCVLLTETIWGAFNASKLEKLSRRDLKTWIGRVGLFPAPVNRTNLSLLLMLPTSWRCSCLFSDREPFHRLPN